MPPWAISWSTWAWIYYEASYVSSSHSLLGYCVVSSVSVAGLKDVMNAPIEIPILSALYRKGSGEHDLSMTNAVCLLVAIPSTVLYKAVTGKRIRDDPELLAYIEQKEEFKSSMLPEKSTAGQGTL